MSENEFSNVILIAISVIGIIFLCMYSSQQFWKTNYTIINDKYVSLLKSRPVAGDVVVNQEHWNFIVTQLTALEIELDGHLDELKWVVSKLQAGELLPESQKKLNTVIESLEIRLCHGRKEDVDSQRKTSQPQHDSESA